MTISREELQTLVAGVADLGVISDVLNQAVSGALVDNDSDKGLKPTGQLSALADRISGNMNGEDLERLLEIAEQDIDKNSRFGSLLGTIAGLAKSVKENILPLVMKK